MSASVAAKPVVEETAAEKRALAAKRRRRQVKVLMGEAREECRLARYTHKDPCYEILK